MRNEISAGGIIYRKNASEIEIAMILDSFDKWTFPKGHLEDNEKPPDAAKRESEEETGLKNLVLIKEIDKIDFWFKEKWNKGELIHKIVYYYLFQAPKNCKFAPQLNEIKNIKWVKLSEMDKKIGYKNNLNITRKIIKYFK